MSRPASVAAYTVRDALVALRTLVMRHQEAAQNTDLFLVMNDLLAEVTTFTDLPAFKALERAAQVEVGHFRRTPPPPTSPDAAEREGGR